MESFDKERKDINPENPLVEKQREDKRPIIENLKVMKAVSVSISVFSGASVKGIFAFTSFFNEQKYFTSHHLSLLFS